MINLNAVLGYNSLIFSALFVCITIIYASYKLYNSDFKLDSYLVYSVLGNIIFAIMSFLVLVYSYYKSDFSLINIYNNSHTSKPLIYKITGVWANHEGSFLLWLVIFTAMNFATLFSRKISQQQKLIIILIQSILSAWLLIYVILYSNPFLTFISAPKNGLGMNPLLQDIGLIIHPPILYLGYSFCGILFSYALAIIFTNRFSAEIAKDFQHWILYAFIFLTLGIVLGSWWAYRELGWGGFWFWDPVENSSLLPWLCVVALLHTNIAVIKRKSLKKFTLLLALFSFVSCLISAFLVRSGILSSVHSFAFDVERGKYLLILILVLLLVILIISRGKLFKIVEDSVRSILAKDGGILINGLLSVVMYITIFLATIFPLIYEYLYGQQISIGEPYFVKTLVPLFLVYIFLCGVYIFSQWNRQKAKIFQKYIISFALSILVAIVTGIMLHKEDWKYFISIIIIITLVVNIFITIFNLFFNRYKKHLIVRNNNFFSSALSHFGLAILAIGILAVSYHSVEKEVNLKIGDVINWQNYNIELHKIDVSKINNYITISPSLKICYNEINCFKMVPELRIYNAEQQQTSESAIKTSFMKDFYVAVSGVGTDNIDLRLYIRPLMNFIWIGSFLIILGGIYAKIIRQTR